MVKNRQPKAEKFIEDSPEETQANLNSRNGLYERLEVQQSRVICGPDVNYHVSGLMKNTFLEAPYFGLSLVHKLCRLLVLLRQTNINCQEQGRVSS